MDAPQVVGVVVGVAGVVGGPWAVTWREVVKLRQARYDQAQTLTALNANMEHLQVEVGEIREDVRQVRDGLLAAGVIRPA